MMGYGGDHADITSEHRLLKKAGVYLSPGRTRVDARTALGDRTPQEMVAALTA
jgi:hypothetical protein